jgi:mono/diheme cytochrome c family protein
MTMQSTTTLRYLGTATIGWSAAFALAITLDAAPPAQRGDDPPPSPPKVDAKATYEAKCQACHLADGNSQLMPNMSFADGVWVHGSTVKEVAATITNGVPGTAMVAFKEQLSSAEISALAKFVRKFDKKLK